jgi:hypothetical protein
VFRSLFPRGISSRGRHRASDRSFTSIRVSARPRTAGDPSRRFRYPHQQILTTTGSAAKAAIFVDLVGKDLEVGLPRPDGAEWGGGCGRIKPHHSGFLPSALGERKDLSRFKTILPQIVLEG